MNQPHDIRPEDDERLSAYVFGHLSAEESAEVEARLQRDPAAREIVDQLRKVADSLEAELQSEPKLGLTADQRARIEQAEEETHPTGSLLHLRWFVSAAAAVLLAVLGFAWLGEEDAPAPVLTGEQADESANDDLAIRQHRALRTEPNSTGGGQRGADDDRHMDEPPSPEPSDTTVVPSVQREFEVIDDPALVDQEMLRRMAQLGYSVAPEESLEEAEEVMPEGAFDARYERAPGSDAGAFFTGDEEEDSRAELDGFFADGDDGLEMDDSANAGEGSSADAGDAEAPAESPAPKKGNEKSDKQSRESWKPAQVTPNATRLQIGDDDELPLRGVQASVQVDGFRARVILDCLYENDRDRQFEGSFKLRLPDGATPWFFAFGESAVKAPEGVVIGDVFYTAEQAREMGFTPAAIMADRKGDWEKPKEARMVPKEKAAHAYLETVRRRVDPALMEWAGAGVFSARVFPLTPRRFHRIVVGYDVDLLRTPDRLSYRLDLPRTEVPVQVDLQVLKMPGLEFEVTPATEPHETEHRAQYFYPSSEHRSFELSGRIEGAVALMGDDPDVGSFFAASLPVPATEQQTVAGSRRAVFLLDTSLSSSPDLFQVWARLLPEILAANEGALEEFAVLFFDVSTQWWKAGFVPNDAAHRAEIAAAIDGLGLEGATDLCAALHRAARPEWLEGDQPHDLFLLSDGAATWGDAQQLSLSRALDAAPVAALYAYRTGFVGTDLSILDHLARESGGAVFSVTGQDAVATAAVAHRQAPWQLDSVSVDGVEDVLVAGRPASVYPGQILGIAGRGRPAEDATLVLNLSQGERRHREPVVFQTRHESPLAARVYGQIAVRQLETYGDATESVSRAYATHFRVTGRSCSLLMLESEADYERFDIQPEEDAFVIGRKPVGPTLDAVLADLGDQLASPKRRFLAFVDKLSSMPGMEFEAPTALKLVLEDLPDEAFEVRSEPLEVRHRDFEGTPGRLQDLLAARKVDYEWISEEAQRRLQADGPADAMRALSSLVEVNPGDGVMIRDVAFSALEWNLGATAYHLLQRVAEARPFEPQTYWNLALCLEQMGRADLALAWFEVALAGEWDARFGEFDRIVGVDYLRFLRRIQREELDSSLGDYVRSRHQSLSQRIGLPPCALVVTMQWNTDRTDVDMHVIEPTGEECYYSHRDTRIGGHITRDVTQGYGPEMYTLPRSHRGEYRILAHYFASDDNRSGVRSKVSTSIYRDWGTDEETVTRRVVTLTRGKDKHLVSTVGLK